MFVLCDTCSGEGTVECGTLYPGWCDSDPCHGHCEVACNDCTGEGMIADSLPHERNLMALHPSTQAVIQWFEYDHLPIGPPQTVSARCWELAHQMTVLLGDTEHGAELTAGMRKLLEAKDCFVRAALNGREID